MRRTTLWRFAGLPVNGGDEYARQEHTDPPPYGDYHCQGGNGGRWARLPVRTTQSIPKAQVRPICQALWSVSVTAPIKIGTVIVSNILNSGSDIVASRDMPTK